MDVHDAELVNVPTDDEEDVLVEEEFHDAMEPPPAPVSKLTKLRSRIATPRSGEWSNRGYRTVSRLCSGYSSTKACPTMQHLLDQSLMGISFVGCSFSYHFLEICAGSAILTKAVRFCKLTALDPIDLNTGHLS